MNLANKHSKRYSGVVNKKAISVAPASDNKGKATLRDFFGLQKEFNKSQIVSIGFVLTIKKGSAYRPGKSNDSVTFKAGPRRSLHKVKLNKLLYIFIALASM